MSGKAQTYAEAPQEIRDGVEQLIRTYGSDPALLAGAIVSATLIAVLAATADEREACAQLIEKYDLWFSFEPTVSTGGMGALAPHATPVVAAAIRKRGEA